MLMFECNGFIDEAELTLLLSEITSDFCVGHFEIVNATRNANIETAPTELQLSSPSPSPAPPRATCEFGELVAKLDSAFSDMTLDDDQRARWVHHDLLIHKLTQDKGMNRHQAILFMTKMPLLETQRPINCVICLTDDVPVGQAVVLKNCLHTFCKECISRHIESVSTADIQCPFVDPDQGTPCRMTLQSSEVQALVSQQEYERHYVNLIFQETEAAIPNAFHCKTPDCRGFCIEEGPSRQFFRCPVCSADNCLRCKELHNDRISCAKHRQRVDDEQNKAVQRENEKLNLKTIDELMVNGLVSRCPKCKTAIEKKGGCSQMTCKCKGRFTWKGVM